MIGNFKTLGEFDQYRTTCPFCNVELELKATFIMGAKIHKEKESYIITYNNESSFATVFNMHFTQIVLGFDGTARFDKSDDVTDETLAINHENVLSGNIIRIFKVCMNVDCHRDYEYVARPIKLTSMFCDSFIRISHEHFVSDLDSKQYVIFYPEAMIGRIYWGDILDNLDNVLSIPWIDIDISDTERILKKIKLYTTLS